MNDKIIGRNPVLEAIRSGRSVDKILVKKGKYEGSIVPIIKKAKDAGIIIQEVERAKLDQIAEGENHQGVIAYVSAYDYVSVKDILDKAREKNEPPFIIICDKITDPHNLGACIRTAAAMGVQAVIVPRDRSASLTPTARKVAAGGAEKVAFIQVTNLARTLAHIKDQHHMRVVGTMLDEKALPIQKFDFTGAVTIVMGAEDTGLRPITQSQCDQTVYIPMAGNLQSLNVSVAAGMALYEACRQRNLV